jgi:hypothetical protein
MILLPRSMTRRARRGWRRWLDLWDLVGTAARGQQARVARALGRPALRSS